VRLAIDWQVVLQAVALFTGAIGIVCSMMIYIDTRRAAWSFLRTGPLFLGTLLALGAFGVAAAIVLAATFAGEGTSFAAIPFLVLGLVALGAKLRFESALRAPTKDGASESNALANGARLMRGPLRVRSHVRLAFAAIGALGAVASIASIALGGPSFVITLLIGALLLSCTFGEFVERHLYFTAEASPSMPGH